MDESIAVNGMSQKIKNKALVFNLGPMDQNMLDFGIIIKQVDMED